MFCFSLKQLRVRIFMIVLGIIFIFTLVFIVRTASKTFPVSVSALHSGNTHDERIEFLNSFGWIVQEDPVSVSDVLIPAQFGDVYENYNAIQLSQGFDLQPYAGRSVKKWVYAVTNYPGYSQSEVFVRATILICQGRIIGGDICSVELDGFMHGFAFEAGY